jgi:translocation and assembly module TamA
MLRRFFALFVCLLLPVCAYASGIRYSVDFEGIDDGEVLRDIRSISQLTSLKKRPPASVSALRYRAESDVPDILKVLHAHGYYEATVRVRVEEIVHLSHVIVTIDPGPVYTIGAYDIHLHAAAGPVQCPRIRLRTIGIRLGQPVRSEAIVDAELKLLQRLSECGYPLAHIDNREMIADGDSKTLRIRIDVDAGPLSHFGPLAIEGTERVKPALIQRKLAWAQGEQYDSRSVEETQTAIMDTGLFSSVLITHDDALTGQDEIAMRIEVAETKHRSMNIGGSYQTFYGSGVTLGWENRNVGGMGRKLSIQGDATRKSHSGVATFVIPHFRREDQNLVWQAQAFHEAIKPYSERTYNLTGRLDRRITRRFSTAVGAKIERLYVTESVQNGNYLLFELPLYARWSSANSLLNPTRGATLEYRVVPAIDTFQPNNRYLYQEIVQSTYKPLDKEEFLVIAQKITFGMILSDDLSDVPLSKRIFGGSEDDLRGYGYQTVSPIKQGKPEGGRSALFYSLEARFRATQTIGLVPFFDVGNVYTTQLPTLRGKWLKSVGLGLRYFSFVGPLRFDVGVPLNRRHGLDPRYRILVSIGQMF